MCKLLQGMSTHTAKPDEQLYKKEKKKNTLLLNSSVGIGAPRHLPVPTCLTSKCTDYKAEPCRATHAYIPAPKAIMRPDLRKLFDRSHGKGREVGQKLKRLNAFVASTPHWKLQTNPPLQVLAAVPDVSIRQDTLAATKQCHHSAVGQT